VEIDGIGAIENEIVQEVAEGVDFRLTDAVPS
jgi:hypothetical protein